MMVMNNYGDNTMIIISDMFVNGTNSSMIDITHKSG